VLRGFASEEKAAFVNHKSEYDHRLEFGFRIEGYPRLAVLSSASVTFFRGCDGSGPGRNEGKPRGFWQLEIARLAGATDAS
jgi:hypothetical protein